MELIFFILFLTILFVSVFQIFVPFLVKRTVVFGVSIPYDYARHPKVMQFKKKYALITSIVAIVVLGGFFFLDQGPNNDVKQLTISGVIFPFIILLMGLSLYFYFHYKMIKLKNSEDWYGNVRQVHYAELTIRSKDEMLASYVHLIPVIISIGLIILSATLYNQLPDQIPTHWGADGKPNVFSDKSWMVVLGLPIILIIMQLMFYSINLFTKRSGIKISAGNVTSSKLRQLRLRKYTSWFLFIANILITLLFAILQLDLIYGNILDDSLMMFLPIGFFIIMLAGALWLAVKIGSVDSDFEGKPTGGEPHKVEGQDEDQYWKGGLIYLNRNDPSIFVEKRFGIGYTMNFANPIGYLIILIPIVLIILISFFF